MMHQHLRRRILSADEQDSMNRMLINEASTVGATRVMTNTTMLEQAETSIREAMLAAMEDHINNSFNNPTDVPSNGPTPCPPPAPIEDNTDPNQQLDSGVQGCRDHSYPLCSKVIENMSCDNIVMGQKLSVHCPLSCNTCELSHGTNCQDLSSIVCAFATGLDRCNEISFNKPMKEHCPRSCGECDEFRTDRYAVGVNVIDLPPSNTQIPALKYLFSFGIACAGLLSLVTLILVYKKRSTYDEKKTPHKRRDQFARGNTALCSSLHSDYNSKNKDTDTVDVHDGSYLHDNTYGNIQPSTICDSSSSSAYSSAYQIFLQGPKESQIMLQDDKQGNLEMSFSQDTDFRRTTNKRNQDISSHSATSNVTNTARQNISHDLGASNFLPVEIADTRNSTLSNLHNVERQTISHHRDDSFSSFRSDIDHGKKKCTHDGDFSFNRNEMNYSTQSERYDHPMQSETHIAGREKKTHSYDKKFSFKRTPAKMPLSPGGGNVKSKAGAFNEVTDEECFEKLYSIEQDPDILHISSSSSEMDYAGSRRRQGPRRSTSKRHTSDTEMSSSQEYEDGSDIAPGRNIYNSHSNVSNVSYVSSLSSWSDEGLREGRRNKGPRKL
mmetsp:Transcript_15491/g.30894  ORF Transcript_15491/g.30894 Transcript_15491/m.30894 type:complete len:609 (-) Transcript_15491:41-1867(-)